MEFLNTILYHETLSKVKKLTLGEIIEGIQRRDNKVLTYIYKELFPVISSHVTNHGGTTEDAKDVFQETIIIIFRQIEERSLDIKTGFENYLFGIARLIWLKLLRKKEIHTRNINFIEEPETEYNPTEDLIDEDLELRIFRKHFLEMGEECQKIGKTQGYRRFCDCGATDSSCWCLEWRSGGLRFRRAAKEITPAASGGDGCSRRGRTDHYAWI